MKYVFTLVFLLGNIFLMQAQTKPTKKDYVIILTTELGEIHLLLYEDTPLHRENFLNLASEGFYDGLLFHRVIRNFMIQGGDPDSKNASASQPLGSGGTGKTIPAEILPHRFHKKGALAAARLGDEVNPKRESSGSQFYIVQGAVVPENQIALYEQRLGISFSDEQKQAYTTVGGTPHLDGTYTVFGEVLQGLDIIDAIAEQRTGPRDRPLENITMKMEVVKISKKEITEKYGYQY